MSVVLGFDFGYRRIGVAVGQSVTGNASPLKTLLAEAGVPRWEQIQALILEWSPSTLVVGLPTCINDEAQYTTKAARRFSVALETRFHLPTVLVDERLTTKEARSRVFSQGGYRQLSRTPIDSMAACLIVEQWLQTQES